MPLVSATQLGQTFVWGFQDADAPTIGPGFFPNGAEVKYAPEKFSTSEDGEGHVDSVTLSKAAKRMWTTTFTGRITSEFDPATFPVNFNWLGRIQIITSISKPLKKGEYAEVTLETVSYANVV